MHETERHRVILAAVQAQPVATISDLVEMTGTSEATIRRDIAALACAGQAAPACAAAPRRSTRRSRAVSSAGPSPSTKPSISTPEARHCAARLQICCSDGEPIIINGGTTTYQMVHYLTPKRMSVFTNSLRHRRASPAQLAQQRSSFPAARSIASRTSSCRPSAASWRRTSTPSACSSAARASVPHGLMEADPMVVQSELALINQAGRN